MQNNQRKLQNLQMLKLTTKFEPSDLYTGVLDIINKQSIKHTLQSIINLFIELVEIGQTNDEGYQDLISDSLARFNIYGLDTEDRERICSHFEEIMNAIELQSSGGVINEWLYGFKYEIRS